MKIARYVTSVACIALCVTGAVRTASAKAKPPDRTLQIRLDAIKSDPQEPRNHYNLAIEYHNRDMLDQASKAFQKALKVGKKNKEAHADVDLDCYQNLGFIALRQKKYGKAADWFASGLKLKPNDPVCLFRRGQAYFYGQNPKAAKKALEQYLSTTAGKPKASKQAPTALTYLGAMAMEKRQYNEAAKYFRQVIKEYPKQSKEAGTNLAIVLLTQGDRFAKKKQYAQAAPLYDEAAAADPSNADALKASARAHYELGTQLKDTEEPDEKKEFQRHFTLAERNFLRATKIDDDDFQSWYFAGLSQFELEKYGDMINSYTHSVKINPNQAEARYMLGLAQYRKQQFADALRQAEEAKKLSPKDRDTNNLVNNIHDAWINDLMNKGTEAISADRINEAIGHWEGVVELDPHNPDAPQYIKQARVHRDELIQEHTQRGDTAYQKGDLLTASNEWTAAAQLDPDNQTLQGKLKKVSKSKRVEAIRRQALAAYNARDMQTAMAKINEVLKIKPKDAATLALKRKIKRQQSSGVKATLANVDKLIKAGKLLQAKRNLERARKADPKNKQVGKQLLIVNTRIDNAIKRNKRTGTDAMRSGDKEAARKAFEAVLAFNPNDREAATAIKKLTGKESKAKVSAEKIKKLNRQGIFAYMQNDLKGAEKAWAAALKLDPDSNELKRSLSRVRTKMKKARSRPA